MKNFNVSEKYVGNAPLIHGTLDIHAVEAKNLPDTDNLFFNISHEDLTDPYLEVCLGPASLVKTKVIRNCLDPVWDEKFNVAVCHHSELLRIKVCINDQQINSILKSNKLKI